MKTTHTIETSISSAFIKAFDKVTKSSPVIEKVLIALDSKAGIVKRHDWNAHLSFKTAETLKKQGILV